jgi:lipoyl(octanoyl) transferase
VSHPDLSFLDLGLIEYSQAISKQKELWQKRVNEEISDTLIFAEHPAVFTIGKHGKEDNLLIPFSLLKEKNISLFRIERGGDITFHGPGQIVGYPIFKIKQPLTGVKRFVNDLEQILVNTLSEFDISARIKPGNIGVWNKNKKIASLGIAIAKRVSFHGFALNVTTDLSYFDMINPCGNKQIKMTSMEKVLLKNVSLEQIKIEIERQFIKYFNF